MNWIKFKVFIKNLFTSEKKAPPAPLSTKPDAPPLEQQVEIPKWAHFIQSCIEDGVAEIPGSKDHPLIKEAHALAGLKGSGDLTAWCSSFMLLVFIRCGVPQIKMQGMKAWARDWASFGVRLATFKPYCLVVIERNGPGGDSHITCGIKIDGDMILCWGGNQNNKVCPKWYPLKDVLYYRWPDNAQLIAMGESRLRI